MLDLVIEGGELVDGSGAPRRHADLGIAAGIVTVIGAPGSLRGAAARRRIDAAGHVVAPGFIDSHTHDDLLLLQRPERHPKLLQGVTTVVTGNCGISLAPLAAPPPEALAELMGAGAWRFPRFGDYVAAVRAAPPALNAALLVGHTTLRLNAMADVSRAATPAEVQRMQDELADALAAGALGLSTGVYYPLARAATTAELIGVGAPLQGHGLVTMHIRDEADAIDAALREALAVGRALDVDLVLSHHKLMGQANFGRSRETLALVDEAAHGQRVCLDCYPYDASSTMLLVERVAIARDVQITWSRKRPEAAGRLLSAIAAEQGVPPTEAAARLQPAGAIYFAMDEADVERILAHPLAMVGSDGLPHDAQPHPRLWGTFPRVLGRYARERGLLSLETAVHKMTGLPARRFGLAGRGLLREGAAADITVFDAATVADHATYDTPDAPPESIACVLVNGVVAVEHGEGTGERAGALLRRKV